MLYPTHPWKQLAEENEWTFTPRDVLTGVNQVTGTYKNYHIELAEQTNGIEIILSALGASPQFDPNIFISTQDIDLLLVSPRQTTELGGYIRVEDYGQKLFFHQWMSNIRFSNALTFLGQGILCEYNRIR